jgi:hypothetical protein
MERAAPTGDVEQRRADLADAVVELRARTSLAALLAKRRRGTRVEVASGAEELMGTLFATR